MTEAKAAERSRDNRTERTIVFLWLRDIIARSRSQEQDGKTGNDGWFFCCRRRRLAVFSAAL
jgi:hypothetical protein